MSAETQGAIARLENLRSTLGARAAMIDGEEREEVRADGRAISTVLSALEEAMYYLREIAEASRGCDPCGASQSAWSFALQLQAIAKSAIAAHNQAGGTNG